MVNPERMLKQLDALLTDYEELRANSRHNDLSDQPKDLRQALVTRAIAISHRIAGPSSPYAQEISRIQEKHPALHEHTSSVIGVVRGLRADVAAGYVLSLIELIHADTFADILSVAEHLLEAKYKDAAAVTAGAALEGHLRNLCRKHGIDTEDAHGRPKKLDRMNADLAAAQVHSRLDQKNVTAWADLRNKAAHGLYGEYEAPQVSLMLSGVADFLRRVTA